MSNGKGNIEVMRETLKQVNKLFILLYFFIIPAKYSSYILLSFIVCSVGMIVISALRNGKLKLKKSFFLLFVIMLFVTITGLLLSTYSMINTIQCFLFLVVAIYVYGDSKNGDSISTVKRADWFYWCGLIAIIVHFCIQFNEYGLELNRFYLPCAAWDINVGALPMFAFYGYCDSKRYKIWMPIAVLTTFFGRDSRGNLLIFGLFLVIKVIKIVYQKFGKKRFGKPGTTRKTFLIIMGATILTVAFSFYWTFSVSLGGVSGYHDSLNDDSNAVRFRANVYTVGQVFGSKDFILFGYDDDIRTALGDIDSHSNYQTFMGYRLVQSHNSILNMFMKNGIIFTLIYIFLLSGLLKKYYDWNHIEYWLPYLLGAMIVHSMFITGYLLSLLICLDAKKNCITSGMPCTIEKV